MLGKSWYTEHFPSTESARYSLRRNFYTSTLECSDIRAPDCARKMPSTFVGARNIPSTYMIFRFWNMASTYSGARNFQAQICGRKFPSTDLCLQFSEHLGGMEYFRALWGNGIVPSTLVLGIWFIKVFYFFLIINKLYFNLLYFPKSGVIIKYIK